MLGADRSVSLGGCWRIRRLVFSIGGVLPGVVGVAEVDLRAGGGPEVGHVSLSWFHVRVRLRAGAWAIWVSAWVTVVGSCPPGRFLISRNLVERSVRGSPCCGALPDDRVSIPGGPAPSGRRPGSGAG